MKPRTSLPSALFITLFSLFVAQLASAGSATWDLNPGSGDWNTAANWTPATVPNGLTDIATFGVSNVTNVSPSLKITLSGIEFVSGASAFTLTVISQRTFQFVGNGIQNDSGIVQNFFIGTEVTSKNGTLLFTGSATAGDMTTFTNFGSYGYIGFQDESRAGTGTFINLGGPGSGVIEFYGSATGDHATFINNGSDLSYGTGGEINFYGDSTAGNGTYSILGASQIIGIGGTLDFFDNSTADQGTFICEGASIAGEQNTTGGLVILNSGATAGNATFSANGGLVDSAKGSSVDLVAGSNSDNATFIANGGQANGALGGYVYCGLDGSGPVAGNGTFIVNGATVSGAFGGVLYVYGLENATIIANPSANGGGRAEIDGSITIGARIELFGDGWLNLFENSFRGTTVGSIEGDGMVSLGRTNLTTGTNNLSTTFSGVIEDGDSGQGGSLTKIGTGTLTLTGANTYTGITTIESGILLANNTKGSATGKNNVQVHGGTLGGGGKIAGRVIVGTGVGAGATLGPGARGVTPGTLTIRNKLTLMRDATYTVTVDSSAPATDDVRAKGVSIHGAQILFYDRSNTVLAVGTIFTVIDNTAAAPISGTFSNLADGSTVTIGSNTFQANYEGGDGNDLTLTVVP